MTRVTDDGDSDMLQRPAVPDPKNYDVTLELSFRQLQAMRFVEDQRLLETGITAAFLVAETTPGTVKSLLRRQLLVEHPRGDVQLTDRGRAALAQAPLRGRRPRGFAAMSDEKQREIASLGGKTAHARGAAHEFTPETGRAASLLAHAHRKEDTP